MSRFPACGQVGCLVEQRHTAHSPCGDPRSHGTHVFHSDVFLFGPFLCEGVYACDGNDDVVPVKNPCGEVTPAAPGPAEQRDRPSWDEWFIEGAKWVATRADCTRRKAGTVIVKDNRVIATGYNGAPSGMSGCLSGGCPRGRLSKDEVAPYTDYDNGPGRCVAVHSEANAIIHARREDLVGATLYCVPGRPCSACSRLIHGAGIGRVVYLDEAGDVVDTSAVELTRHLFAG